MNKKQINKMLKDKQPIELDDLRRLEVFTPFVKWTEDQISLRIQFKDNRPYLVTGRVLIEHVEKLTVDEIFDILVIKIREATDIYFEDCKEHYNSSKKLPPLEQSKQRVQGENMIEALNNNRYYYHPIYREKGFVDYY